MNNFTITSPHLLASILVFSALFAELGCSGKSATDGSGNTGGNIAIGGSTNAGGFGATGGVTGNPGGASGRSGGSSGNPGGSSGSQAGATSTSTTSIDPVLSAGIDNTVSSGGYWWTYTDHNPAGNQYHASISQVTSQTVALQPTQDSDITRGSVLRVQGSVPPSIPWTLVAAQDPSSVDQYWKAVYYDALIPAYPEAGIGFGFRALNAPFDATGGGKWIGIAFDMKIGADTQLVWVSMPMVGTDLPDPAYADKFPKQCEYYTAANPPSTGYQTCMTHYRKGLRDASVASNEYSQLGAIGTWKRYCVLFSEVGAPFWASPGTLSHLPAFDPTKLLKVQWSMFQPAAGAAASSYDVSLDNVQLITRSEATDASNHCNPAMLDALAGTGGEG